MNEEANPESADLGKPADSISSPKSSSPGKVTVKVGCGIMLLALAFPLVGWALLYLQPVFGGTCSECGLGWGTVIATWLAIPIIGVGGLVALVGAIIRANEKD